MFKYIFVISYQRINQFLNLKVIHLKGRLPQIPHATFTILQVGTSIFVYSIIPQYFFNTEL